MNIRGYALPVLVVFLFAGVFGVYFMFGPMHESVGCPFFRGETVLCASSILEHLNHWQIAFSSILAELLVTSLALTLFVLLAFADSISFSPVSLSPHATLRVRHTPSSPRRKFIRWLALFENSPTRW